MPDRPRILVIGPSVGPFDATLAAVADVEPAPDDPAEVARRLQTGDYAAVVTSPATTAGLLDRFRTAHFHFLFLIRLFLRPFLGRLGLVLE